MRRIPLTAEERLAIDWANIPERLTRELTGTQEPWLFAEITGTDELLNLLWLNQPPVQMVVKGNNTPLATVVDNVLQKGLCNLRSAWWDKLHALLREPFVYGKMQTAAITPARVGQRAAEADTFRIFEGQHRALALALHLHEGMRFETFRMLLLDPGRRM
jgi:hypothetical protein